jgi:hypothetical protein
MKINILLRNKFSVPDTLIFFSPVSQLKVKMTNYAVET